MKSKVAAGILAIFFGGIGAHKFYLGSIGAGFLYLLFCWTGIPAIAGVIEGIVYLTMSEDRFDMKYNPSRMLPAGRAPQQNTMAQNIVVNVPGVMAGGSQVNVADQLAKLNELRVAGALTEAEFVSQKTKLLQSG